MPIIAADELKSIYERMAVALGAPSEEAVVFADCMRRADLRGMGTQGAAVVPYLVWLIEHRLMRFGAPFRVLREEAATVLVDGGNGVGSVVAWKAMDLAVRKAKSAGTCAVWVRAGGDFAMASNHALQALEYDQVGICMRNCTPRVAPWGGRDPFFGTDPMSVAIPTGDEFPIVIDMAAGSFSVGQVVMAARDHVKLPSPHLVDVNGRYTDDPAAIIVDAADRESKFTGGIVSLGHKGLAWSLVVELLAGLLSGLGNSSENDFEPTAERPWREGMFFMAIDVSKLLPVPEFKAAADALIRSLRAARPAQGFERVRVPGEVEAAAELSRLQEGVPVREEDWAAVTAAARRLGVEVPQAE